MIMYREVGEPKSLTSSATNGHVNSGGLNFKNDPTYEKRDKIAKLYYDNMRTSGREGFVKNIARNSGMKEKGIEKIFEHIFIKKHNLRDGFRYFDPSYDMAESFRRLMEGNNIQPHDLILLKHEWLELGLMKRYGYDYDTAHNITKRKYDYDAALNKWLKERGDW